MFGLASRHLGPATFAVRSEDLVIDRVAGLPARIEHREFLGEATLVHLRHEASQSTLVARVDRDHWARFGDRDVVHVRPSPGAGFLFDADGRRLAASPITARREVAHG